LDPQSDTRSQLFL